MAEFDPNSPEWHAFRMSVRLHHGHVLEVEPCGYLGKCVRCMMVFTPRARLRFGWMTNDAGKPPWIFNCDIAERCPGRDYRDG